MVTLTSPLNALYLLGLVVNKNVRDSKLLHVLELYPFDIFRLKKAREGLKSSLQHDRSGILHHSRTSGGRKKIVCLQIQLCFRLSSFDLELAFTKDSPFPSLSIAKFLRW